MVLLLAATISPARAAAQTPASSPAVPPPPPPTQQAPVVFAAPDGTRFVLVPDAGVPQVHWAVASWADGSDDPAGFEGLARAAARAAQLGTWRNGSRDAERERRTLGELDAAWQQLLADPHDAARSERVRTLDREARELADLGLFPRLLAAAPAHRLEVIDRGPATVLVATTVPDAIGELGKLLVERRDEQPLRGLAAAWLVAFRERLTANAADPDRLLRAEVLALALPGPALGRWLEAPAVGSPTRDQALATWAATQRPERTVHVLLGDFDAARAREVLAATFTTTTLPPYRAAPPVAARPLAGVRRSVVPGTGRTSATLAWVLPSISDRHALATAAAWLGDGPDSHVGQELQRAGRVRTRTRCEAPWPPAGNGRSLLLLEVQDDAGGTGLADLVLRTVRAAVAKPPSAPSVQAALAARQHAWREANATPRQLAVTLAVDALLWPGHAVQPSGPMHADPKAVQDLLARLLAGEPVVIEGRP